MAGHFRRRRLHAHTGIVSAPLLLLFIFIYCFSLSFSPGSCVHIRLSKWIHENPTTHSHMNRERQPFWITTRNAMIKEQPRRSEIVESLEVPLRVGKTVKQVVWFVAHVADRGARLSSSSSFPGICDAKTRSQEIPAGCLSVFFCGVFFFVLVFWLL